MKKILLIEDNPDMRENTLEILQFAGYDVVTAVDGKDGVQRAREHRPDLILCDIMMPEMDGYGVLFLLNRDPQTAGIPFIFLTAKADKSEIRKGMNLGADDYLTSPMKSWSCWGRSRAACAAARSCARSSTMTWRDCMHFSTRPRARRH
jgi:CheY-like chemotaxis protein